VAEPDRNAKGNIEKMNPVQIFATDKNRELNGLTLNRWRW
jgi:hypothetical protein